MKFQTCEKLMNLLVRGLRSVARVGAVIVLAAAGVQAEEIKVMTSGALSAALRELAPSFERASGSTLIIVSGGSVAGAPDSIPDRLQRGERADVLIMAAGGIDDLMKAGRVVAGSRVDLARSSIGIAVRAGAPKPDISSVDALKRTLLQAKSIAYSSSVSGVYVSTELFQRLGIANQVLAKSRKVDGEPVAAVVARGEAEIGFQQISELRPVPGIEVVGPLPPEVQRVTVFSAAAVAGSTNPSGGRALIAFLSSPAASPAIAKSGMDPVTPPAAPADQVRAETMRCSVVALAPEQLLEVHCFAGRPAPDEVVSIEWQEEVAIFRREDRCGVLGRDDVQQTRDEDDLDRSFLKRPPEPSERRRHDQRFLASKSRNAFVTSVRPSSCRLRRLRARRVRRACRSAVP